MAKKVFEANLSVDSVEQLKKELLQYKNNELKNKCKKLIQRLSELGLEVAEAKINTSPIGGNASVRIETKDSQSGSSAMLIASGAIKEVEGREPFDVMLAIEFGSGIYYNKEGNPKADEFGLGPGTYPGQIHAFEDGWYYWDAALERWRYTHGIQATMPMYKASQKIIESIEMVAKEVFE